MSSGTAALQCVRNNTRPFDAETVLRLSLLRKVIEQYSQPASTSGRSVAGEVTIPTQINQEYFNIYFGQTFYPSGGKWTDYSPSQTYSGQVFDLTGSEPITWITKVSSVIELPYGQNTVYLGAYSLPSGCLSGVTREGWLPFASGPFSAMTITYTGHDAAETAQDKNESFLGKLYRLSQSGQTDDAIDSVIEWFDRCLNNGDLDTCKQVLQEANAATLHSTVALSVLSMTLVEKAQLGTARRDFYSRVKDQLISDYGLNDAEDNLRGLE